MIYKYLQLTRAQSELARSLSQTVAILMAQGYSLKAAQSTAWEIHNWACDRLKGSE